MSFIKRIFFLVALNIAIIATISILIALIEQLFDIRIGSGNDLVGLFIFAAVVGFAGAIISLYSSIRMAKSIYGIKSITSNESDPKLHLVFKVVQDIAHRHHIKMPQVGYYQSNDTNAFATGPSKNNSLVAVSTGLLDKMDHDEIEGVVGHEMAHILNGDMVTMTLMQGVLNTFVIFLARILGRIAESAITKDEDEGGGFLYYMIVWIFEILLGILASLVLFAYSRHREYKADEGSAHMLGKTKMIKALQKLKTLTRNTKQSTQDEFATLKISGGKSRLIIFQTHPDINDRINHLEQLREASMKI